MCKDCTTHTAPADDMDGGVAAALIEKEAERKARGTATDAALARYWLKEYDRAEARAEKAEDRADDAHNLIVALRADLAATEARAEQADLERDEARAGLTRLARALDLPDTATVGDMIARIEEINCHDCIRDAAVIREPLTPDAITDEMVERGAVANWRGDVAHPDWTFEDISDEDQDWYRDNARAVLTAALTESPARPEGLTRLIDTIREATYDPEPVATGEALYNAGVRVVTEEQP